MRGVSNQTILVGTLTYKNLKTSIMILLTILFVLNFLGADDLETRLDKYNPKNEIESINQEINFWENKLSIHPNQLTYHAPLAQAYQRRFDQTASIKDLRKAEMLLATAISKTPDNQKSSLIRSLSQNLIKQHKFCEALDYMLVADLLEDNERANDLILFDIYQEIGLVETAGRILDKIGHQKDFNYFIRRAKMEDSRGDLTAAIQLMERAHRAVENSENKILEEWVLTNLGDFYGHANKIDHSTHCFSRALELNPNNWYALKGLAWIAYAHEKNIEQADKIIKHLSSVNKSPSLMLFQAELENYRGHTASANKIKSMFAEEVQKPDYGAMYNKYLIELFTTKEHQNLNKALKLAEYEIGQRPTPESYSLLAYVLYQSGKRTKAQKISQQEVLNKTSEPDALMHLLEIFQDNKELKKSLQWELSSSTFEIGPLRANKLL